MSKVATDLICTCGSVSMWARNHDAEKCDLWLDDQFANEEAIWASHDRTLKEAPIDWHPVEPARTKSLPPIEESVKKLVKGERIDDDPRWKRLSSGTYEYIGHKEADEQPEPSPQELDEARRKILLDMNPDEMTDEEWWELELILQREQQHLVDSYLDQSSDNPTAPSEKKLVCKCNPPHTWVCRKIAATREGKSHEWTQMTPEQRANYGVEGYKKDGKSFGGATTYTAGDWDSSTYVPKCRHNAEVVEFPDGTKVWASSQGKRKPGEPEPTMGLYMADSWRPKWPFFRIPWSDFDLPEGDFHTVAWVIETAFNLAKDGDDIEVGCIGGHGRTGTVLACMAVLGGVKAKKAAEWVQKNYCDQAVEGERQKWFVLWFDAARRGVEPPKMPEKPVYTSKAHGDCMESEHFRFIEKGDKCWKKDCKFWDKDVETYLKKHGSMPDPKSYVDGETSTHTPTTHENMLEQKHACGCKWWEQDTRGVVLPKARSPLHEQGRRRRRNQKRRSRRQHNRRSPGHREYRLARVPVTETRR